MAKTIEAEVVVLGSGPGGYAAAFRAADLGLGKEKKVVLVERYENIGGVCLNVGCIPSKALLHVAKVIDDVADVAEFGVDYGKPKLDIKKIRSWKENVVKKLTGGLKAMAKQRKVEIVTGVGKFTDSNTLKVEGEKDTTTIKFNQCVIAAGSLPVKLPFIPDDPRIIDSTGALELEKTDGELLVLGGGIIGLEMATVYRALGAKIHIVEMMDQLMPGADKDVVKPFHKYISQQLSDDKKPSYIIPVPLHRKRLRVRGFNQALELARPVAKALNIPIELHACQRIKHTLAQAELKQSQRKKNLKNAFATCKTWQVDHVVIIDDVVTTGSTINALKTVLYQAGVKKVDTWCLARAMKK